MTHLEDLIAENDRRVALLRAVDMKVREARTVLAIRMDAAKRAESILHDREAVLEGEKAAYLRVRAQIDAERRRLAFERERAAGNIVDMGPVSPADMAALRARLGR